MSKIDTSTENVAEICRQLATEKGAGQLAQICKDTLRALAAERDESILCLELQGNPQAALDGAYAARDAALADARVSGDAARHFEEKAKHLRVAWLRVIQAENTCWVTGMSCDAMRCACAAEQEMLIKEAQE